MINFVYPTYIDSTYEHNKYIQATRKSDYINPQSSIIRKKYNFGILLNKVSDTYLTFLDNYE